MTLVKSRITGFLWGTSARLTTLRCMLFVNLLNRRAAEPAEVAQRGTECDGEDEPDTGPCKEFVCRERGAEYVYMF